jgi:hypothetical protein
LHPSRRLVHCVISVPYIGLQSATVAGCQACNRRREFNSLPFRGSSPKFVFCEATQVPIKQQRHNSHAAKMNMTFDICFFPSLWFIATRDVWQRIESIYRPNDSRLMFITKELLSKPCSVVPSRGLALCIGDSFWESIVRGLCLRSFRATINPAYKWHRPVKLFLDPFHRWVPSHGHLKRPSRNLPSAVRLFVSVKTGILEATSSNTPFISI